MARCWELLEEASKRWDVPMACITSHMREGNIPKARRWLQLEMLALGLKRNQVAWAFGLDVRRVRASEIGGPRTGHGRPGGDRFRKVDLLGHPLPQVADTPKRKGYRDRFLEALDVLKIAANESEVARKWVSVQGG